VPTTCKRKLSLVKIRYIDQAYKLPRLVRVPEENRLLRCAKCDVVVDRDVNAARNILARGMRFVQFAPATEAMAREPSTSRKVASGYSNRVLPILSPRFDHRETILEPSVRKPRVA